MYIPVVGLEIHVQAKTKTKMFCRCASEYFETEPNSHVCPVCFGLPGALPVPNEEALNKIIKLALALNCSINQETKFDRKNYFYPDLAKGYQISQYDQPVGYEGYVEIEINGDSRRIRIQRVHMEEDTAKSLHGTSDETLIDYNKSGVPLIEIVTYPDFDDVTSVILFAKRLKQIVKYLDISDAEMQKGQMRFELNISVREDVKESQASPAFATATAGRGFRLPDYKVEVKNIGSISVLEKVLRYEVERQSKLLEKGEKIHSQTRGLKGMTGETVFQRSKETADDYRYFPEPDIPPIHITDKQISDIKGSMPELPHERKQRYVELGLEGEQADVFVEDRERGAWFDEILGLLHPTYSPFEGGSPSGQGDVNLKEIAKWILGDISGWLEKKKLSISESPVTQQDLIKLVEMLNEKKISGTITKKIIEEIFERGGNVDEIIKRDNLIQIFDSSEVEKFAKEAIETNQKVVADIAKNPNAFKFLVGQVMRLSKGKVNPKVAEEELRKILEK